MAEILCVTHERPLCACYSCVALLREERNELEQKLYTMKAEMETHKHGAIEMAKQREVALLQVNEAKAEAKKFYDLYCNTIYERDRAREEVERLKHA